MERISKKDIHNLFEVVTQGLGKTISNASGNIGEWYLDYYSIGGGYVINELVNKAGGVKCPFGYNRMKIREFYNFLYALSYGLQTDAFKGVK